MCKHRVCPACKHADAGPAPLESGRWCARPWETDAISTGSCEKQTCMQLCFCKAARCHLPPTCVEGQDCIVTSILGPGRTHTRGGSNSNGRQGCQHTQHIVLLPHAAVSGRQQGLQRIGSYASVKRQDCMPYLVDCMKAFMRAMPPLQRPWSDLGQSHSAL
jgi:hypothetical protein